MSNMVVQTNVLALNSHRNMKIVGNNQSKASQKLSSGYKINSAADDAAGLAISEKMRAQIRGLDMASKNAQDAISLIQTAEGGMQEIDNMLQRIRELVNYASNDTQDADNGGTASSAGAGDEMALGDRQKIQDEINTLMKEIDSMANRVEYNKKKLINGDYAAGSPAAGTASASDLADLAINKAVLSSEIDKFVKDLTDSGGDIGKLIDDAVTEGKVTQGEANKLVSDLSKLAEEIMSDTMKDDGSSASDIMDKFADKVASLVLGFVNDHASAIGDDTTNPDIKALADGLLAIGTTYGGFSDISGAIGDVKASTAYGSSNSSGDIYFQVGANSGQGWSLNIGNMTSEGLGIASGPITEGGVAVDPVTKGNIDPASGINVLEATGADINNLLDKLDLAISKVTTERSKLGAAQNRLEYTIKSLDISNENLTDAESRIRDTDMAKEMMNYTKANVLQQATVSMLAQANQAPQSVLKLLG